MRWGSVSAWIAAFLLSSALFVVAVRTGGAVPASISVALAIGMLARWRPFARARAKRELAAASEDLGKRAYDAYFDAIAKCKLEHLPDTLRILGRSGELRFLALGRGQDAFFTRADALLAERRRPRSLVDRAEAAHIHAACAVWSAKWNLPERVRRHSDAALSLAPNVIEVRAQLELAEAIHVWTHAREDLAEHLSKKERRRILIDGLSGFELTEDYYELENEALATNAGGLPRTPYRVAPEETLEPSRAFAREHPSANAVAWERTPSTQESPIENAQAGSWLSVVLEGILPFTMAAALLTATLLQYTKHIVLVWWLVPPLVAAWWQFTEWSRAREAKEAEAERVAALAPDLALRLLGRSEGVTATLVRAEIAERQGRFKEAYLLAENVRYAIGRGGPELAIFDERMNAVRAMSLIVTGQDDWANAVLARLVALDADPKSFAQRLYRRCVLVQALRRGDFERAHAVALHTFAGEPEHRDVCLAMIADIANKGARGSIEELAHVAEALASDDQTNAWIEAVLPGLRAQLLDRVRVAPPPVEHEPEEENEDEASEPRRQLRATSTS